LNPKNPNPRLSGGLENERLLGNFQRLKSVPKVPCALILFFLLQVTITAADASERNPVSRDTLVLGQEVYRTNCAVCHGVGGDGAGPAASMFLIRPRDFRSGIFKFRSTPSGSLPSDDDLLRTVTQGLRWTGMIGRLDLAENSRRAVIQYVKTLATRFAKEQPGKPVNVSPAPPKTEEILTQGKRLYRDVGCIACHGERGRGDGASAGGLKDEWGWPIWPSDLTWRPLKRGSDTKELYRTLVTGLSGTPMPSYADSLTGQEIWALVYYLESLVPPNQRLSSTQILGEERQGWMVVRMGGMMGPGMMYRP
jgi:cytochrome c oxidase cbb3-type subunit I/II